MTEPSDEELERAERIRKLRSGGARSRGHQRREERWAAKEDVEPPTGEDEAGPDTAHAEADETDADAGGEEAAEGALGEVDTDVVALAEDLPELGSLFVVPVHRDLRRRYNRVAEELHLRYGFEFDAELDTERHVRPLALYLGAKSLEDADVELVRELLHTVEELEAPTEGDGGE